MTKIFELLKYSHLLYDRKYVIASDGNLSIRTDNRIIITPTGYSKGDIRENDLLFADINGNYDKKSKKRPSMEMSMHLNIYKKDPNIKAVIHAHPINVISYFLMNEKIDLNILPEAKDNIKNLNYADYYPAGSSKLASEAGKKIKGSNGIIVLKKHGVIAYGDNLQQCFFLIERLDFVTGIMLRLKG